ncbi:MAG: protoporphyrinogen oxidase [Deltaproteobacteria bacterium]|nr:protoporphyrinogen oxidase [Deltaproteobacteria bacterium]
MTGPAHVCVVGAGIAGLATAFLLRERARAQGWNLELVVLEARPEPGGHTRSDMVDGFLCERGANGFLDNEPATLELVDRLGLRPRLQRASEQAARRFIYYGGKMRELPTRPLAFLRSDILSWRAKLRVALEPLVRSRRDGADETVDGFGRRRLGPDFTRYLLGPMVSGVFAGDARRLSGGPAGPAGTLHTLQGGMGELTGVLAAQLADVLRTGVRVRALGQSAGGFSLGTEQGEIRAEAVVLACPSYEAAAILAEIAPAEAELLGAIAYAPVDVVCQGYGLEGIERPCNGFGVLVPREEGIRSLGVLCSDQIFPGQAPAGFRLLRAIAGGAHDPAIARLGEAELRASVAADLRALFGVHGEPRLHHVVRHEQGIAQYDVGHLGRVAAAERLERDLPGLLLTGAAYRGVSVNGCVKDAQRVVEALAQGLGRRPMASR